MGYITSDLDELGKVLSFLPVLHPERKVQLEALLEGFKDDRKRLKENPDPESIEGIIEYYRDLIKIYYHTSEKVETYELVASDV